MPESAQNDPPPRWGENAICVFHSLLLHQWYTLNNRNVHFNCWHLSQLTHTILLNEFIAGNAQGDTETDIEDEDTVTHDLLVPILHLKLHPCPKPVILDDQ